MGQFSSSFFRPETLESSLLSYHPLPHIQPNRKSCLLCLQNTSKIQPLLTVSTYTTPVSDASISCLDYFNGLSTDPLLSLLPSYSLFVNIPASDSNQTPCPVLLRLAYKMQLY